MKTVGQFQTFFEYRDQHVCADRDPNLRLDCILAGTQKGLDPKVLLDPFEEQLDLPSLSIECGNHLGAERKVVGQKGQAFAILVFGNNAANHLRIVFGGVVDGEHAGLIADDLCVRAIDWLGVSPLKLCVGLGSRDKERLRLMNGIKPLVVEVAAIQQIERPWLDNKIVQHVDLVRLAVRNADKAWDCAPQVEKRMQFDRTLGSTKRCPRVHRQAQIDRSRIERINRCVQIDTERLVDIKRPRNPNQMLSIVGINLPRPRSVRIGQSIARQRRTTKSHVVQTLGLCTKIDLDVAKRLSISQLRKSHCEELIQAGEVLDLVIATMRGDATPKSCQWQMHHDLRKNEFALVHEGSPREVANNPQSARNQS